MDILHLGMKKQLLHKIHQQQDKSFYTMQLVGARIELCPRQYFVMHYKSWEIRDDSVLSSCDVIFSNRLLNRKLQFVIVRPMGARVIQVYSYGWTCCSK